MKNLRFFLCIGIAVLFCSCETTKVYIKTSQQLYEDDFLVEETSTLVRFDYKEEDGKTVEEKTEMGSFSKHYYDIPDNYIYISNDSPTIIHRINVEKEKDLSSAENDEKVVFSLIKEEIDVEADIEKTRLLGKRTMSIKNGEIVMSSSDSNQVQFTGSTFSGQDLELFEKVSQLVISQVQKDLNENEDDKSIRKRTENVTERVTVISTSNTNYILYSFLGKPLVIAGATAWNVLKCAGYALINFGGGYNLTTGKGDSLWKLPSFKDSQEKAAIAREENRIKYYPEYHIPFTDNKIIVDKYDKNIEVEKLVGEDAEQITAVEHQEYDNSMSVSLSAKADAASTAATANLVGTVVTIPVSVVTWVAGAAYGIYDTFSN